MSFDLPSEHGEIQNDGREGDRTISFEGYISVERRHFRPPKVSKESETSDLEAKGKSY